MHRQDQVMTPHSSKPSRNTALGLLLVATMSLAACAATDGSASDAADPGVTSAPAETAAAAPARQAGDIVAAEEADKVNADSTIGDDKAYPMPDGTFVFVEGDAPAPASVIDAAGRAIMSETSSLLTSSDSQESLYAAFGALDQAIATQRTATGKVIVWVGHLMGGDRNGPGWVPTWSVGGAGPIGPFASKEEAVAAAQVWVDEKPEGRLMVVVDNFSGTLG